MKVEDVIGVPIFSESEDAISEIRAKGPDSCCIMGTKGKVAERFLREDRAIWAHEQNVASLPLGCLSSAGWLKRIHRVSIFNIVDAGKCWVWKGRGQPNSVLVALEIGAASIHDGFAVQRVDVDGSAGQAGPDVEDLGDICLASLQTPRTELVLETTVEDARRIRQLQGVRHISQRKV